MKVWGPEQTLVLVAQRFRVGIWSFRWLIRSDMFARNVNSCLHLVIKGGRRLVGRRGVLGRHEEDGWERVAVHVVEIHGSLRRGPCQGCE